MPNRHPRLSLLAQCRSRIEQAKAELRHARKRKNWTLGEETTRGKGRSAARGGSEVAGRG